MNHNLNIQRTIGDLQNDKNANPKWKNWAIRELEVIQSVINGKLSTREISKGELQSIVDVAPTQPNQVFGELCICNSPTDRNPDCSIHGM